MSTIEIPSGNTEIEQFSKAVNGWIAGQKAFPEESVLKAYKNIVEKNLQDNSQLNQLLKMCQGYLLKRIKESQNSTHDDAIKMITMLIKLGVIPDDSFLRSKGINSETLSEVTKQALLIDWKEIKDMTDVIAKTVGIMDIVNRAVQALQNTKECIEPKYIQSTHRFSTTFQLDDKNGIYIFCMVTIPKDNQKEPLLFIGNEQSSYKIEINTGEIPFLKDRIEGLFQEADRSQ